jgi:hypothetical protein
MEQTRQSPQGATPALYTAAGADRFGARRSLGISVIDFMEAFFQVTKANAVPHQDPELWRPHGMELAGPPLAV